MTLQEILFVVSIVFFVLAAIFIVLAVVVFFVRNIPDVRADLSGKKRAAAVAEIAAQRPGRDRRKGVARVEPTSGNLDSGNLSEPRPLDNPLNQVPHVESVVSPAPAQPVAQQPQETYRPQPSYQVSSAEQPSDGSETTILPEDETQTTILGADEPQPAAAAVAEPEQPAEPVPATPIPDDAATTILPDDDTATTILPAEEAAIAAMPGDDSATTILPAEVAPATPEGFVLVRKIVLRESTEFITAH